jgi:hypothetical protein
LRYGFLALSRPAMAESSWPTVKPRARVSVGSDRAAEMQKVAFPPDDVSCDPCVQGIAKPTGQTQR